jgi:hypothetical protein
MTRSRYAAARIRSRRPSRRGPGVSHDEQEVGEVTGVDELGSRLVEGEFPLAGGRLGTDRRPAARVAPTGADDPVQRVRLATLAAVAEGDTNGRGQTVGAGGSLRHPVRYGQAELVRARQTDVQSAATPSTPTASSAHHPNRLRCHGRCGSTSRSRPRYDTMIPEEPCDSRGTLPQKG